MHPGLSARTARLTTRSAARARPSSATIGPGGGGCLEPFATIVIVQYPAATTRAAMLVRDPRRRVPAAASFAWPARRGHGGGVHLRRPDAIKQAWNDLVALLARVPGIRRDVRGRAARRSASSYNTAQIGRGRRSSARSSGRGSPWCRSSPAQFDRIGRADRDSAEPGQRDDVCRSLKNRSRPARWSAKGDQKRELATSLLELEVEEHHDLAGVFRIKLRHRPREGRAVDVARSRHRRSRGQGRDQDERRRRRSC